MELPKNTINVYNDISVVRGITNFSKEIDADLIALKLLEKSGMPKKSFIFAIEKLTKHYCIESKLEKSVCMSEVKSGWLSTHPSGAERLEYLKENIN